MSLGRLGLGVWSRAGAEAIKHLLATYGDQVTIRAVVRKQDRARLLEHLNIQVWPSFCWIQASCASSCWPKPRLGLRLFAPTSTNPASWAPHSTIPSMRLSGPRPLRRVRRGGVPHPPSPHGRRCGLPQRTQVCLQTVWTLPRSLSTLASFTAWTSQLS
jgi:hypothetical protein